MDFLQNPEQPEAHKESSWFSHKVSIGNLLTALIVCIGLVGAWFNSGVNNEHRLTAVETAQASHFKQDDERQDDMKKTLSSVEWKLDRLLANGKR